MTIPPDMLFAILIGLVGWVLLEIVGLKIAVARIEEKLGTKPQKKAHEKIPLSRAVDSERNRQRLLND